MARSDVIRPHANTAIRTVAIDLHPGPSLADTGWPSHPDHVVIAVPVRDEQDVLPGMFEALAALAIGGMGRPTIVVLLDGCTDASAAIADHAARHHRFPVIVQHVASDPTANAGKARAAAMALALAQCGGGEAMLLTTDADSRPRADWLTAAAAALGYADVVAGRLVRIDAQHDPLQSRVEAYYDRLHACRRTLDPVPWDPAPGHHHGGGANLACRSSAYRAAGGFLPLPSGEDARFLDDAMRAGLRVRRDPAMVVDTSSRRQGRAPGGLAAALRAIDASGVPRLPDPAAALWQYRRHALARHAFAALADATVVGGLTAAIGLDADHIRGVARDCPNAEAFAMRIVPTKPGPLPDVTLAKAEDALDRLRIPVLEAAA